MSGVSTTSRERLQPSLLDRLTDEAPESRRESFEQQTLTMLQVRAAVLRDLAWLLNTTNLATTEDLLPLTIKSTLNYGIPGLAGKSDAAVKVAALEAGIAEAIRAFEPRINPDTLRVAARPADRNRPAPALVFEIQGEIWAQPLPQQLFVETSIDLETRMAVVTDMRARR